jgi:hypothetical protein
MANVKMEAISSRQLVRIGEGHIGHHRATPRKGSAPYSCLSKVKTEDFEMRSRSMGSSGLMSIKREGGATFRSKLELGTKVKVEREVIVID